MDNLGETPRRRRRSMFGSNTMSNSTDGVRAPAVEEDLADTIVDINRLVEQKVATEDTDSIPDTDLDVYDKETRLRLIHKMKMRDVPKAEMCKKLGVSKHILERDIKELYARLRSGAKKLDVNELIGDSIATYNEVLSMALNHASNTKLPVPTRLAALRTVLSAKNDMHRFLNLAGFYDAAVYKQAESKSDTDIGQLIKVTQAILDKDENSDNPQVSAEQRETVQHELEEIRLF